MEKHRISVIGKKGLIKYIGDNIHLYRMEGLGPYHVEGILIIEDSGNFVVQEKESREDYQIREGDKVGISDKREMLRFYNVIN